jgi:hypothetical protein
LFPVEKLIPWLEMYGFFEAKEKPAATQVRSKTLRQRLIRRAGFIIVFFHMV